MHQLGLGRSVEAETVREEHAFCGEGLLQSPNTLQDQQQQQQQCVLNDRLAPITSTQLQQQTTTTTNSAIQGLEPSLDAISQALQKLRSLQPRPTSATTKDLTAHHFVLGLIGFCHHCLVLAPRKCHQSW